MATGELRRLTQPPPEAWSGDLSPAVSPDGSSAVLDTLQRRVSFGVSASPDNRVVLYSQYDQESTELMLVENFIG